MKTAPPDISPGQGGVGKGLFTADWIKRGLLRINRLLDTLHKLNLVVITKEDLIRFRGGGYNRQIHVGQEGHDRVTALISGKEPALIARIGAVELSCLRFYREQRSGRGKKYPGKISYAMANNAGFFPVDDASLDSFAEFFLKQLPKVDIMGVWFNRYEEIICNGYSKDAQLVELDSLEPFRFVNPWSSKLAGRKVLVVHPFVDSIRKQYTEKRRILFPSPDVLPDFELKTVKTVQSMAGAKVDFKNWFEAYQQMCDSIATVEFDVCIIGAGAYGLPLAAFAKKLGKQAIHLGGVTQILFGIRGKRWERDPAYSGTTAKLFNDAWVRPLESETPANKERVEKGCYW
jgi:hypothetical protein